MTTYDFGWMDHEMSSLLCARPDSCAMVILMEFCNLKSLASNICHTNRFGHHQVRTAALPTPGTMLACAVGYAGNRDCRGTHSRHRRFPWSWLCRSGLNGLLQPPRNKCSNLCRGH